MFQQVCYYGMELLEQELLLFMEYCAEGTLEALARETELPEALVIIDPKFTHIHFYLKKKFKPFWYFNIFLGNYLSI